MLMIVSLLLCLIQTMSFQPLVIGVRRTALTKSYLQMRAGTIESCSISTRKLTNTEQLYSKGLKLDSRLETPTSCRVNLSKDTSLLFYEVPTDYVLKDEDMSFAGIGLEKARAQTVITKSKLFGASQHLPLQAYRLGASMVPDEDEKQTTPVQYASLLDHNGYLIEVVQSDKEYKLQGASSSRIILYVADLDESIAFYTAVLGMTLFRKRSNINSTPKDPSLIAHVGFGDEQTDVCLELKYRYSTEKIKHGKYPCKLRLQVQSMDAVISAYLAGKTQAAVTGVDIDPAQVATSGAIGSGGSRELLDPSGYKIEVVPQ